MKLEEDSNPSLSPVSAVSYTYNPHEFHRLMPTPSDSRLQLIQQEHKCPDCLYLELAGNPIQPPTGFLDRIPLLTPRSSEVVPELGLYLTIQFKLSYG